MSGIAAAGTGIEEMSAAIICFAKMHQKKKMTEKLAQGHWGEWHVRGGFL